MLLNLKPNSDQLDSLQQSTLDIIKAKIKNKDYKTVNHTCFCSKNQDYEIITDTFYPNFSKTAIKIVICKNCGMIRTSPYLNEQSLSDFYTHHQQNLYEGNEILSPKVLFARSVGSKERLFTGKSTYSFLKPFTEQYKQQHNKKQLKIFEIGCGYGGNLYPFYKDGEDVYGCDYGENGLKTAKDKGMKNIFFGDSTALKAYGNPDVIIINHVLEHVFDLTGFFKHLKNIINKDTIVYVGVPNLMGAGWQYKFKLSRFFHLSHAWQFTNNTLESLMSKEGFEKIESNEIIQAVYKFTDKPAEVIFLSEYSKSKAILRAFEKIYNQQQKKLKKYRKYKVTSIILFMVLVLVIVALGFSMFN